MTNFKLLNHNVLIFLKNSYVLQSIFKDKCIKDSLFEEFPSQLEYLCKN